VSQDGPGRTGKWEGANEVDDGATGKSSLAGGRDDGLLERGGKLMVVRLVMNRGTLGVPARGGETAEKFPNGSGLLGELPELAIGEGCEEITGDGQRGVDAEGVDERLPVDRLVGGKVLRDEKASDERVGVRVYAERKEGVHVRRPL
jgi:hypothetical protein